MTRFAMLASVVLTGLLAAGCSKGGDGKDRTPGSPGMALDLGGGVTLKLVRIPPGRFLMGSPQGERDRATDEGPQREITLSRGFYMGLHEVTQEQYQRVMGSNPSTFPGAQNPVEKVTWNKAVEFCRKASQSTGKTVRLPTEAEWEYACRAGSRTKFSCGDDDGNLGNYAWYTGNSGNKTHPVGQKRPNNWGLYDMHGNVREWCADWYKDSYANPGYTDPRGPASGQDRVWRGGGWDNRAQGCRSAFRGSYIPDDPLNNIGFRVVVESE